MGVRPKRWAQASMVAVVEADTRAVKALFTSSPLMAGEASTTSWPRSWQRAAASLTAAMQSGCTGVPVWGLGGEGDAQLSRIGADFFDEGSLRGWRPVGIAEVGAGGGVEEGGAVADGAGKGMLDDQTMPVFAQIGAQGVAGAGGLEAEEAAAGGGDADGAATVAAVGQGDDAGGHGGGGTAAGAARGAGGVPGVMGWAEEAGLGSG